MWCRQNTKKFYVAPDGKELSVMGKPLVVHVTSCDLGRQRTDGRLSENYLLPDSTYSIREHSAI